MTATRRSFLTTVTVDVDIDEEILRDNGWHHEEDECCAPDTGNSLGPAVASLHRQAHPGQHRDVRLCHEEPCRSLTLDQLDEVSQ